MAKFLASIKCHASLAIDGLFYFRSLKNLLVNAYWPKFGSREVPGRCLSAACLLILLPLFETPFYNNFKIGNGKDLSPLVCSCA